MQPTFLQRIRYAMKPYEAYGLIFSLDNVMADTQALNLNSWKQLAFEQGKEVPGDENVQRLLLYASADHALRKVLLWEKSEVELDRLKLRLSELYHSNLLELSEPMDGLKEWLAAAIVTEEDGMESMAHRFLSAAVKLDRKTSMCVVFEDDLRGITAAHNCKMMAIALIGAHPAHDLVQMDLAVAGFNELSVINLKAIICQ